MRSITTFHRLKTQDYHWQQLLHSLLINFKIWFWSMRMLINIWLQKRDVITCFFNGFEELKIKVTESVTLICMGALRNHYSEKSDKSLTVTKLQVWIILTFTWFSNYPKLPKNSKSFQRLLNLPGLWRRQSYFLTMPSFSPNFA